MTKPMKLVQLHQKFLQEMLKLLQNLLLQWYAVIRKNLRLIVSKILISRYTQCINACTCVHVHNYMTDIVFAWVKTCKIKNLLQALMIIQIHLYPRKVFITLVWNYQQSCYLHHFLIIILHVFLCVKFQFNAELKYNCVLLTLYVMLYYNMYI